MKDVFKNIIEHLTLNDDDRESLKVNRGFSDEVIDKLCFRSVSESIIDKNEHLCNLPKDFKDAFRQPNVLIPYPEQDGSIAHVRPHKFGIKGLKIKPYIPYQILPSNHSTLVIAESEFKAVASCIYGVPAIGIPGIASFSGEHFNLLCDVLRVFEPQHVVICFDNEVKDDPELPNYKPDFRNRYDTQFYAYVMARKLMEIGKINTYIATLNPKWMKDNKVDIDGMLASGISAESYKEVIRTAVNPYEFKKHWVVPKQHKSYLERRIDKYFYDDSIKSDYGSYWTGKGKKKEISNFTINVQHSLIDDEGKMDRVCQFISKYGNSHTRVLAPKHMVSVNSFKEFCLEAGDYQFHGTDTEMQALWKYLFIHQDGRQIFKLGYYGYNNDIKAWFFSNGAYKNGYFHEMEDDGIVWINDIGYKVVNELNDMTPPKLSHNCTKGISIAEIFIHMSTVMNEHEARMIIGWALGNFFMPEILDKYKIYPFLFLFGKQSGGKSTIANWISSFFGSSMHNGVQFHQSTIVGIQRSTSQMSMVPLWLEEYRNNDKDIGKKNNYLRSIYDKSTIVKGTKRANEIKTYTSRSTLIISGEEHPHDAALNSRCIQFPIYRETDTSKLEDFIWLQDNKEFFNEIGDMILRNKNKLWKDIQDRIDSYVKSFISESMTVSDRQRTQMSIIGGICDTFITKDDKFSIYLAEKTVRQDKNISKEQALYIFFDDLLNMHMSKRFKNDFIKIDGKEVYFNFSYAYSEWEIYFKGLRNDIPASKQALLEHMKREAYYKGNATKRIGKTSVYCQILKLDSAAFPETLRSILVQMDNETVVDPIGDPYDNQIFK